MTTVTIVEPQGRWAVEYSRIQEAILVAVGNRTCGIDHIGSTSVPGLPAKDVIDVQVSVPVDRRLEDLGSLLERAGWRRQGEIRYDHSVPGLPSDDREWRNVFFIEPGGERRVHLHVRKEGRANHRYALLFRDFLRLHPDEAVAYGEAKRALAALAPTQGPMRRRRTPSAI